MRIWGLVVVVWERCSLQTDGEMERSTSCSRRSWGWISGGTNNGTVTCREQMRISEESRLGWLVTSHLATADVLTVSLATDRAEVVAMSLAVRRGYCANAGDHVGDVMLMLRRRSHRQFRQKDSWKECHPRG